MQSRPLRRDRQALSVGGGVAAAHVLARLAWPVGGPSSAGVLDRRGSRAAGGFPNGSEPWDCNGDEADAMTWQPIETVPQDGTDVDLWVINRVGTGSRRANCFYGYEWDDCVDRRWYQRYAEAPGSAWPIHDEGTPTHWMLPPEPPKP